MPKINIYEVDATTTGVQSLNENEVIYIPGFVSVVEGEETSIEVGKPMLFATVSEFEQACGKVAPVFEEAQAFSIVSDMTVIGITGNMFEKGAYDPSYVLAKECLAHGMRVLYERVNETAEDISIAKMYGFLKDLTASNQKYGLMDKGNFNIKYLTSGGYPVYDWVSLVDETVGVSNEEVTKTGGVYAIAHPEQAQLESVVEVISVVDEVLDASVTLAHPNGAVLVSAKDSNDVDLDISDWVVGNDGVLTGTGVASGDKVTYTYQNELTGITVDENGVLSGDALATASNTLLVSYSYVREVAPTDPEEVVHVLVEQFMEICAKRGDCFAIIDYIDVPNRKVFGNDGLWVEINADNSPFKKVGQFQEGTKTVTYDASVATMFAPWRDTNRVSTDANDDFTTKNKTYRRSAGFAYLCEMGTSVQTNAAWLAVAGVTRGVVEDLKADPSYVGIPNGAADEMQNRNEGNVAINAITQIRPYGDVIWGNRTALPNPQGGGLRALSFLSVRNLVCDVKKVLYQAAQRLTFEPNTSVLWTNFKGLVAPTLDSMKAGYGISGYRFQLDNDNPRAKEKGVLCAKVTLYPVYPVEEFEITVTLSDEDVVIE